MYSRHQSNAASSPVIYSSLHVAYWVCVVSMEVTQEVLYLVECSLCPCELACICVCMCVWAGLFVLIQASWLFVFEEGSPAPQGWPQGCHGDNRNDFLNSRPNPQHIIGQGIWSWTQTGGKREEGEDNSILTELFHKSYKLMLLKSCTFKKLNATQKRWSGAKLKQKEYRHQHL